MAAASRSAAIGTHGLSPGRSGGASGSCRRAPCARASRSSATAPRSGRPRPRAPGARCAPTRPDSHRPSPAGRRGPACSRWVAPLSAASWAYRFERGRIRNGRRSPSTSRAMTVSSSQRMSRSRWNADHVAAVAVEGQRGAAEADVVAVLDGAMGLDEDGVGRGGGGERRAQPGLVDPVVVAVHPTLPEGDGGHQVVVELVGPGEPAGPEVDPRAVVEPGALDLDPGGQLHRRRRLCHSGEGTGAERGRARARRRILIPWGVCVDE